MRNPPRSKQGQPQGREYENFLLGWVPRRRVELGVTDLLFLRAKGLSPARGHDSTYLRGFEDRKAREGAGARRLSYRHKRTEEHIEYLYRYRRCLRTRGIQDSRSSRIGSPHHAPRSEGNRAMKLLDASPMTVNSASRIGGPVPARFVMDGDF